MNRRRHGLSSIYPLLLCAACAPSPELGADEFSVLVTAGRPDGIAFVFETHGRAICAGANVARDGGDFVVTFLRARSGVEVDLPAEPYEHRQHGACQIVHHRIAELVPGREVGYRIRGKQGRWTVTPKAPATGPGDGR